MSSLTVKKKSSLPGAGFGLIGLVLALGVVAVGGAIGGTALLGGSGSSGNALGSGTGSPADRAYDVVAETTLNTAESAVQTVGTTTGYSGISAQTLEFDEPAVKFTSGASTSDLTVSVAASGSEGGSTSTPLGGGQGGGSVTMAAFSQSTSGPGSCLYLWMTAGATWFGAESDQTTCTASALNGAPQPSTPSATGIGWAQTSFPNP